MVKTAEHNTTCKVSRHTWLVMAMQTTIRIILVTCNAELGVGARVSHRGTVSPWLSLPPAENFATWVLEY